jgi:hypothetical protein
MTNEEKLRAAKQHLGERYVLHPVNRVKHQPERTPDSMRKTDVSATWRKYREASGLNMVGA